MNEQARPVFFDDLDFSTYTTPDGFEHLENLHNITVTTTRLRQQGYGLQSELAIYWDSEKPAKEGIILNLNNYQARIRLALDLAKDFPDPLPWLKVLDYVCSETLKRFRSIDLPDDIGIPPITGKVKHAIEPILPLNLPTTIFSPGGKCKSIFADYLAVLFQYGLAPPGLPFISRQGNVLYLDWETDAETHRRYVSAIKAGLGITEHREIKYLRCFNPITSIIESLRDLVISENIELSIIDSQMAATAGAPSGSSDAQISGEYYNCLNSLKGTTLTVDHTTKEGMKSADGAGTPYGSVVKYNRARSIYELRAQQDTDSDHLELALVHQKFNLGRRQKPFGIAIDFTNNDNGELERIDFSTCDLADNPALARTQTNKQRLINALQELTTGTTKGISEFSGVPINITRVELNHHKDTFVKVSKNEWGLCVTKSVM